MERFFKGLRVVLIFFFIGFALILLWRLVFITSFIPRGTFRENSSDVPLMVWHAFRFDMFALSYITVLPFFLVALTSFISSGSFFRLVRKICRVYYTVMITFLLFLLIVDYYFFRNFADHINVVIFDFFDEGPLSLLQTMWQEYPIIWIVVLLTLFAWGVWRFSGVIVNNERGFFKLSGIPYIWLSVILFAGLVFLGMRGSAKSFPIQVEDLLVSPSQFINNCVPNPVYMFKKALKENRKEFELFSTEQILAHGGYSSLEELIDRAGYSEKDNQDLSDRQRVESCLFSHADTIHHRAPNVLLIISESWSQFLLELDSPGCDLQGAMRIHIKDDFVFSNFQSVRNGTIYTLETLAVASPYKRLFSTKFRFINFSSSIANAYNKSGYHTVFLTGMDQAWENCGEGLKIQGFESVIGKYELLSSNTGYSNNMIGVYDEFLMDTLFRILADNSAGDGRPKFIICVTTSNHPPFTMPPTYKRNSLPDSLINSPFFFGDLETTEKYLYGAQYSNNAIGSFLTRLKASEYSENTLVMLTGDHNVRSILNYSGPVSESFRNRVPLYLYLPPYLRDRYKEIRTERWGDHFDIFPTLAPLSLSNVDYLSVGANLLDITIPDSIYYSYNETQILSLLVDKRVQEAEMKARETLLKIYFQMNFSDYRLLNNKD